MGVAALILGIISLVIAVFFSYLGWLGALLGLLGIVLGAMGRKNAKEVGISTGVATGGLACSIIGTVLCSIFYLACVACLATAGGTISY